METEKIYEITEQKIGSTIYLVSSLFKKNPKEDVLDKIERIINNDIKHTLFSEHFNTIKG